jgi:hypothetical protein
MRSNDDRSDVIQVDWSFGVSFLQWNKSPLPQVSWNRRVVECISDFCHHLILQLLVVLQQVPIETVGTQTFVEVAALHCFNNFFSCEWSDTIATSIDLHFFIITNIEVNITVRHTHVLWSLVDFGEVFCNLSFHDRLVIVNCHFTLLIHSLNFCDNRISSSHLQEDVCSSVEFFQLSLSEKSGEILHSLYAIDLFCYLQFLLLFLHLSSCPVPHWKSSIVISLLQLL